MSFNFKGWDAPANRRVPFCWPLGSIRGEAAQGYFPVPRDSRIQSPIISPAGGGVFQRGSGARVLIHGHWSLQRTSSRLILFEAYTSKLAFRYPIPITFPPLVDPHATIAAANFTDFTPAADSFR